MKTYLVNLDKNKERLACMDAQLANFHVGYERFSAVYGAAISPEEKSRSVSRIRSFLARGTKLSDGQIGCALSHIGIYRKMLEDGIVVALILEDDVVLEEGFADLVRDVEGFVNSGRAQVVILSAWNAPHLLRGIVRVGGAACTDAYVITLKAAEKIIRYNFPVMTVADSWTRWSRRGGIEVYRAYPTLVRQDNDRFGSDIDASQSVGSVSRGNGTGRSGLDLIIFRCRRLVEKSIDWCLWLITGR